MSEIKPKMVDGEAVCGAPLRRCKNMAALGCDTLCGPYYRARVAELEAGVERLRTGMAALTAEQIGIAAASTARAEAAEAERDTARDTACRLSEIALAALAFIDALPYPQWLTAEQQEAWDRLQALR